MTLNVMTGGNQGARTLTYLYYQQVGHLFNRCPFVDDKLKQLSREELTNVHQLVLPTITTIVPNVFILGTQAMTINISHTTIHVNYQTTWSQPFTPIIPCKTNMLPTSTYPMWYSVTPFTMNVLLRQNDTHPFLVFFWLFLQSCYSNIFPI